jgi:hypothetical protein
VIFLCYVSYHAHRGKESFDTHVWILETLLTRTRISRPNNRDDDSKPDSDVDIFQYYIIAASFPKMINRMKNKLISTSYYDCLQHLTTFPFIPPKELKKGRGNHDASFVNAIPILAEYSRTKIPFLKEFAKTRISDSEDPTKKRLQHQLSDIYNKDTCIEFHLLLCEYLAKFKVSLDCLQELKLKEKGDKKPEEKGELILNDDLEKLQKPEKEGDQKPEEEKGKVILDALRDVHIAGYYLRTMVTSSVIEAHLQSIESYLEVDTRKSWTPDPDLEDSEDADLAEFQRFKPSSKRRGEVVSTWESYRDWLRLMVHYFDAAEELTSHVKTIGKDLDTISISILSPPQSDNSILPWFDLLIDERFFPTVYGKTTGKEFVDFLNSTPEVTKCDVDELKKVTKATLSLKGDLESSLPAQLIDKIDKLTEQMKNFGVPSLDFDEICEEVLALKQTEDPRAQIQTIVNMLSVLSRQASFYSQLREGPIHTGLKPIGTYHCEAYMASLFALWDENTGKLVGDFEELNMTHDLSRIKDIVKEIKASHVFMHHLNLC